MDVSSYRRSGNVVDERPETLTDLINRLTMPPAPTIPGLHPLTPAVPSPSNWSQMAKDAGIAHVGTPEADLDRLRLQSLIERMTSSGRN